MPGRGGSDGAHRGLREHLDEGQLVELTHHIAVENLRGRFNVAFGVGAAGFSEAWYAPCPTSPSRRQHRASEPLPPGAARIGMPRACWTGHADRGEGGKMAVITESIEISRRPEEVFAYATDYSHFPQWQRRVVSARQEGDAPLAVGSRAAVTRRVGPRQLLTTEEVTELDPPRTWQVRGTGRIPVVAIATGMIESLDESQRSLITIALEFDGHGIGKLLAPLIRYQSRKQLPKDGRRLKELLEHPG
jgi:hypothetical protein